MNVFLWKQCGRGVLGLAARGRRAVEFIRVFSRSDVRCSLSSARCLARKLFLLFSVIELFGFSFTAWTLSKQVLHIFQLNLLFSLSTVQFTLSQRMKPTKPPLAGLRRGRPALLEWRWLSALCTNSIAPTPLMSEEIPVAPSSPPVPQSPLATGGAGA